MASAGLAGVVRFGAFEFDLATRELRKHGVRIRVPDQSTEILAMLVAEPGAVVSRESIRDRLWPHGTVVEFEHSVNTAIKRLRDALCDTAASPQYIETLPKKGYRFIAAVERSEILAPVRKLSHYEILERIGEGGMGVVYKARDTRLGRLVALKVLAAEAVEDPERNRRFVQEARAASALNHPNIVTIYDIGAAAGETFIAMELVDGTPLDRMIPANGLPLRSVLNYGSQIADALAAAHSAGIVHRDIKPANIVITTSEAVKVLDFGVAKLADLRTAAETTLTAALETKQGTILGTVAYMSPEQAEGRPVDGRSDIFSLGSVLYEMATGQRAFSGDSSVSTLASILRDEPKPVTVLTPAAPPELEQLIHRCLRKDLAERFQRCEDLKAALEVVTARCDSGLSPARRDVPFASLLPRRWLLAIAGAVACLAVGVLLWTRLFRSTGLPPKVRTFTGLPGIVGSPAFSPEGKRIAFSWNGENQDNFDIYVQLLDEPSATRLTTAPGSEYNPVWSPDGLRVAFLREGGSGTDVVVIPAAGGTEHALATGLAGCSGIIVTSMSCGLAWSPDGKYLALEEAIPGAGRAIFLLNPQTREKRRLTTPGRLWDGACAFSPDGRRLAFVRGGPDRPLGDIHVVGVSARGEPQDDPRRITTDNVFINGLSWSADGKDVIFSSNRAGVFRLWRVPASGGEPRILDVGGNDSMWPAVAQTGNRLAYAENKLDMNVWRVGVPGAVNLADAVPTRLTRSTRIDTNPSYSPDGTRIVWTSVHSGAHQIWVAASDGKDPRQLTHLEPGAAEPRWSPDGRLIAFNGYTRGPRHVYVIGVDGGEPRVLTPGDFSENAEGWSRDGAWVYFTSDHGDGLSIWKAPGTGGAPVLVAKNADWPNESLDGRFVFYNPLNGGIWKAPTAGACRCK